MRGKVLSIVAVFVMILTGKASISGSDEHQTTVRPGQSIQAAIDAASPGTRIDVQAGTYHENVEITKDGIHLNGHDAILEPPTSRHATRCDVFPEGGAGTGICFAGVFDPNTLAVSAPLNDAELEGFIVRGFAGNGALAIGVDSFEAEHDKFAHNGGYGIFSSHSTDITFESNVSHDNGDAGFYIGESPNADAEVEDNQSFANHGEGILFRDSTGASIEDNELTGNCAGLIAVDTGAPGADGNAAIEDNHVSANDLACAPAADAPPLSGIGIAIGGAVDTTVHDNRISDNVGKGPSVAAGGIIVFDTTGIGGTTPKDVRVSENSLQRNAPADIVWDHSGSQIVFDDNRCGTSTPAGLCASGD